MGFSTTLFITSPDENLVCTICHDVFADPVCCHCGHSFCAACLEETLKLARRKQCPICRLKVKVEDVIPNMSLRSLIGDLEIQCPNNSDANKANKHRRLNDGEAVPSGCNWKGKLSDLEAHKDKDCGLQEIQCEVQGCEFACPREDMGLHLSSASGITEHMRIMMDAKIAELKKQHQKELDRMEQLFDKMKQRINDVYLTVFCREWVHNKPDALRDFVVYIPPKEIAITSLLFGIPGPKNTPYEGGMFPLVMTWDEVQLPPTCKFPEGFLHVNVHPSGAINESLFMRWYRTASISGILFGIQQLLADPRPYYVTHDANAKIMARVYPSSKSILESVDGQFHNWQLLDKKRYTKNRLSRP